MDFLLDQLLQQETPQPPVEEGTGCFPVQDVLYTDKNELRYPSPRDLLSSKPLRDSRAGTSSPNLWMSPQFGMQPLRPADHRPEQCDGHGYWKPHSWWGYSGEGTVNSHITR